MLHQYEPNVRATIAFLKLINVKVNNTTVNETLQNHPDWPSMLCITDSLSKWNIPNGAGKIDVTDIDQLPTPFIAYTYEKETPLAIVTQVTGANIQVRQKNYSNPITETREEFFKKWNGVYLLAESNEHSGEINYEAKKRKAFFNSLIPVAAFAALIILSLLLVIKIATGINTSIAFSATSFYLQYLILLSGVIVTALLLWYEMDKNNPLLQKVCTGIAKGDCNAVLTGKQAKLFSWLSWSEVGFFYFTGCLLVLLFSANTLSNSIALIAWLNILTLPYTIFSIYYQWRVAKQWCVLCLAVQSLLVLGAINAIANGLLLPFPQFSISFIVNAMLLYLLPALIWYSVKPYLLRLQEAKNTKTEYLRIKFNTEIFNTLLKKQKAVTKPIDGLGIDLGNPVATNTLIKVCNPYCGPCAKAHPKIEKLMEENENLKVKIIFTAANNEENLLVKPVRHLLAIAGEKNEIKTKKALDDWYLPEKKDYEQFAAKYLLNGELLKQNEKIERMSKWCKDLQITATPTIFINGYQLPDAYSIEDLEYFLLD